MDISLSLRMTRRSTSIAPALFIASYAMPADIAPSPITAMQWRFSFFSLAATAMPRAAEIEVEECAVIDVHRAGVVHRFVRHAGRHRAIADHGDAVALLVLQLGGDGHAEGG